jgi:hypothetical protein
VIAFPDELNHPRSQLPRGHCQYRSKGFSLPVGTRIVAYTARFKIGQIIGAGSSVVGVFTGAMALSGFSDSFRNNAQVDKALADCNAQFPQANHSTLGIFATTY